MTQVAGKAFRAFTVTFNATALLSITDVSINESGENVALTTDASPTVMANFVDNMKVTASVTTTDFAGASSITVGSCYALIIVFQQRAEGSGASGTNKTATMTTATVVSKTPKAGTNGIGPLEITFEASGPAGTSAVVWS